MYLSKSQQNVYIIGLETIAKNPLQTVFSVANVGIANTLRQHQHFLISSTVLVHTSSN